MHDTLSCENLTLAYRDGERTTYALRDVSMSLPPGKFYGIMGPSGSGKSSLLYLLSGLKRPTEGKVALGELAISHLPDPELMRQHELDLQSRRVHAARGQKFTAPLNNFEDGHEKNPRGDLGKCQEYKFEP